MLLPARPPAHLPTRPPPPLEKNSEEIGKNGHIFNEIQAYIYGKGPIFNNILAKIYEEGPISNEIQAYVYGAGPINDIQASSLSLWKGAYFSWYFSLSLWKGENRSAIPPKAPERSEAAYIIACLQLSKFK